MLEVWKDIIGYKGYYQVSNLGRVKSLSRKMRKIRSFISKEKILKQQISNRGYPVIMLQKNSKYKLCFVHRLVMENFIGKLRSKLHINHKDGNKRNNKLTNLEWITVSENHKHAFRLGLKKHSEKHMWSKLSDKDVLAIYHKSWSGKYSFKELAIIYSVDRHTISRIKNKQMRPYTLEGIK